VFIIARDLTIPLVDETRWRRGVCALATVGAPLMVVYRFVLSAADDGETVMWGGLPAIVVVLIITVPLAFFIYCRLHDAAPPQGGAMAIYLLTLAFISSCVWTDILASELVEGLEFLGVTMGVSRSILGLTILAWGNSIGDFVADTALARAGNPKMGAAGCFGGPLFNMCIGTGVALMVSTAQRPNGRLCLAWDKQVPLGIVFLLAGQAITLAIVPLSGFKLTKRYGLGLVLFYGFFLICSLLLEITSVDLSSSWLASIYKVGPGCDGPG